MKIQSQDISGTTVDSGSDLLGDSERGGRRSAQTAAAKGTVCGGTIGRHIEQILIGDAQLSRAVQENRRLR
jgi:hypothetical protein